MNGAAATGNELFAFNPAVRADYLNLPRDLAVLTRSFGINLTTAQQHDAAALAFAIECTDRLLDAIRDSDERARFCASVASRLRGDTHVNGDLTSELGARLDELKEIGKRRHIHARICDTACELLENSEQMRTARTHARFVECAVKEGRLMVGMLLFILADVSTPRFEMFMRQLSEPANLVDKLRDARHDFQNGEIAVKPTFGFRLRLIYELLRRTALLAPWCVTNWRLAGWGARSLCTELVWFRH